MAVTSFFIVAVASPAVWLERAGRFDEPVFHAALALLGVAGLVELWRVIRRKADASPAAWVCIAFGGVCLALVAAVAAQREYTGLTAGVVTARTALIGVTLGIVVLSLAALAIQRWRR